ncbi:hypothetical protein F4808DRAFT_212108 [Astrocystis sublimbata]|nr:hypothetical protein F4808DRAFT_212108 [Astrocystis sublimbata]
MALPSFARDDLITNVILPILAAVAVAIRFYGRKWRGQPWKADDYTILVALVLCLALGAVEVASAATNVLAEMSNGFHGLSRFRKFQFAEILITHPLYGLTKISTVLLYRRIFTVGRTRIATVVLLVLISVFVAVSFFTFLFCARGVSSFWNTPPALNGTQFNLDPSTLVLVFAVIDIALDLSVLITPLPAIRRLNLTLKKRIAVSGVFLLGAFCLVCSLIRLYFSTLLVKQKGLSFADRTYSVRQNILWADIECYASTIAACLPTFPMVFKGWTPQGFVGSIRSVLSAIQLRSISLRSSHSSRHDNAANQPKPPAADDRGWVKMDDNLAPKKDHFESESELACQPSAARDVEMQAHTGDRRKAIP